MNTTEPAAPGKTKGDALVGTLAAATVVTSDLDRCRTFYSELMGLEPALDHLPEGTRDPLTRLWGLEGEGDWEHVLYQQPGNTDMPYLRVIGVSGDRPEVRPGMNALLEGGLAVGFACADMEKLIAESERMGFGTVAGVTRIPLHRPDGSPYDALETHLRAPDGVYVLGIARPPDLAPICPISEGPDRRTGVFEPGFNNGQRSLDSYTKCWIRSPPRHRSPQRRSAALAGCAPARNAILQVFAPGSESKYLVFLDWWDGAGLLLPHARRTAAW